MTCSKCGKPHDRTGQYYCPECHAAYQRQWRAAFRQRIVKLKAELGLGKAFHDEQSPGADRA